MLRRIRAFLFRALIRALADGTTAGGLPGKNKRFSRSFKHALRGILYTAVNERNFRIECAAAAAATALGIALGISTVEWAVLTTNIFLVLALEAKNTSLELTTDIAAKDYDYNAKGSKDASSGGVLLASFSSVIVGLFIFGPRIAVLLRSIVSK